MAILSQNVLEDIRTAVKLRKTLHMRYRIETGQCFSQT